MPTTPQPDSNDSRTRSGTLPEGEPDRDEAADDGNSASTLIEAPVPARHGKLQRHDFPDGGGSGGAEAFRRKP
ncbi:MAG: hypothetical protein JWQ72_685 [Polaromonas sp.]|nr:hypothetical protein [Polaromonas sp.]